METIGKKLTIAKQEIINQMKQDGPIGLDAVDLRWTIFEAMEEAGLIARLPFPWLEETPQPRTDPKTWFAAVRSEEEINDLKLQWAADGTWDIEDTEGFELYRIELLGYSIVKNMEWEAGYKKRLEQKAQQIGAPGNTKLAAYIINLEMEIQNIKALL